MENRLMTIMFLDMQGYTKKSARQTIEEMKLFHDQMFKFVTDLIEKHHGRLVKSLGDGFMVCFESPTNAVQAGIEIQRKLEARNAQMMNPENLVRFRIGINTGEVGIDENGDLFGDPVNIAARIQTFADTNDVFISESTFLAMNRNEFGAVDLGAQELKNATREIRIYKILKNGSPGTLFRQKLANSKLSVAAKNKKFIVAAVVLVVLVVSALLFVLIRQISRNWLSQKNNQRIAQTYSNRLKTNSASLPNLGKTPKNNKTILDLNASNSRLRFSNKEKQAFKNLQNYRKNGNFSEAEKISVEMIYSQPKFKKITWGLILAEILFEQGKNEEAEKVCSNILKKANNNPVTYQKLIDEIDLIRRKYRK